jgi:hypothetical protein
VLETRTGQLDPRKPGRQIGQVVLWEAPADQRVGIGNRLGEAFEIPAEIDIDSRSDIGVAGGRGGKPRGRNPEDFSLRAQRGDMDAN